MKYYIGSDECLKGDTFGGIIVAAVLVDEELRAKLRAIGVDDSKKIADKKIPVLAKMIRDLCKYTFVRELLPEEYNEFTQTQLLNQLHAECARTLKARHLAGEEKELDSDDEDKLASYTHIVDQYPGCKVGDIAKPHAEAEFVEVAAASILAREAGLKQFDMLSKLAGFTLPMGSTHVAEALTRLKYSKKDPRKFVKLHFRNVQEAFK
ncbi:MAG TPA: hypothetical protein VK158_02330 [Acidobacteriota bacterium]|nr:hypothetical protein [Acidobacteriota bacterium]